MFADVGCSTTESELDEPIENLRNIGTTSAQWLRSVHISTIADLKRLGPVLAFLVVKRRHAQVSLNLLWALAAGLTDRDWRDLTEAQRTRLKRELEAGIKTTDS